MKEFLSESKIKVFLSPPADFQGQQAGVGCFCISQGRFLLLKRAAHSVYGGTWCSPGGKIELDEPSEWAIQRELKEETGITRNVDQFEYLQKVFIRDEQFEYSFHIFRIDFQEHRPSIVLSEEHVDFKWLTLSEIWDYPLLPGETECYRLFYG